MSKFESILGIDFGASKIVTAFYDPTTKKCDIVSDNEENRHTACCVAFTKNERLFSKTAENQAHNNPENTLFGRDIKPMIGNLTDCKSTLINIAKNNDNDCMLSVNYKNDKIDIFPEHVIAMLLSRLKENAEKKLGRKVSHAVLAVPSGMYQRNALKNACVAAGMQLKGFINNTTAAAVRYAAERSLESSKTVLIFDMGATSIDIGVFKISKNYVKTLVSNGSLEIGGESFVQRLVDHFVKELQDKKINIEGDKQKLSRLRATCEKIKQLLSDSIYANEKVENFHDGQPYTFSMERYHFEALCFTLFKQVVTLVSEIRSNVEIIDEFIVIGGGGNIPKVEEVLKIAFGTDKLSKVLNQEESVAIGTAYFAAKEHLVTIEEETKMEFLINDGKVNAIRGDWESSSKKIEGQKLLTTVKSANVTVEIVTEVDANVTVKVTSGQTNDSVSLNQATVKSDKVEKIKEMDKTFEAAEKEQTHFQQKLDELETKCLSYKRNVNSKELCGILSAEDKRQVKEICDKTLEWIENSSTSDKTELIRKREGLDEICVNIVEKRKEEHNLKIKEKAASENLKKEEAARKVLQQKVNELQAKCHSYKRNVDSKELCDILSAEDKRQVKEICENTLKWIETNSVSSKEELIKKREVLDECVNIIEKRKEEYPLKMKENAAFEHFIKEEYGKAFKIFNDLISQMNGNNALVAAYRCKRGQALYFLQKFDEAIQDFDFVMDQNYDDHLFYDCGLYRARCFFKIGKYDKCVRDTELLLKENDINDQLKTAVFGLKIRATLAFVGKSIEFGQNTAEFSKIDSLLLDKSMIETVKQTDKNLIGEIFHKRGICKYHLHDYEAAINDLNEAVSLMLNHLEPIKTRAYCYFKLGKIDEAESDIKSLGRTKDPHVQALKREIEQFWKNQRFGEDMEKFENYLERKDYPKLLKVIELIRKEYPPIDKDLMQKLLRAKIEANYFYLKNAYEGVRDCTILLSNDENDYFALRYRAKFNVSLKNKQVVEKDCKKILEMYPGDEETLQILDSLKGSFEKRLEHFFGPKIVTSSYADQDGPPQRNQPVNFEPTSELSWPDPLGRKTKKKIHQPSNPYKKSFRPLPDEFK